MSPPSNECTVHKKVCLLIADCANKASEPPLTAILCLIIFILAVSHPTSTAKTNLGFLNWPTFARENKWSSSLCIPEGELGFSLAIWMRCKASPVQCAEGGRRRFPMQLYSLEIPYPKSPFKLEPHYIFRGVESSPEELSMGDLQGLCAG